MALPLNPNLTPQEQEIVSEQIHRVTRYAVRNFLRECQHNMHQYLSPGSQDENFRNTYYNMYIGQIFTQEVFRNMLRRDSIFQPNDPTGGDWDRINLELPDGTLRPIDHVRLLGKTTGVTG